MAAARILHEGKIDCDLRHHIPCRLVMTVRNVLWAEFQDGSDGLGNPRWSPCEAELGKAVLEQFVRKVLAEGWTA